MASHKAKLLLSLAAIAVVSVGLILILQMFVSASPHVNRQLHSATLLNQPLALSQFTLVDHHNQDFTQNELIGRWHLLSYGFLHCPDVCPTTLITLNQLMRRLQQERLFDDLNILFYTVDPQRDSLANLAEYLNFFGEDFTGLRTREPNFAGIGLDNVAENLNDRNNGKNSDKPADQLDISRLDDSARRFERELGIKVVIDTSAINDIASDNSNDIPSNSSGFKSESGSNGADSNNRYDVSHGVTLYLLNPQGRLYAVFNPSVDPFGNRRFNIEHLYLDYVQIRQHYQL